MNVEVRPCCDDAELRQHALVPNYVFAGNDPGNVERRLQYLRTDLTMDCFVDGEVATAMTTWPFTVLVDGAPVPMGGIAAVGTYPQHRRRGYLRKVMEAGFAQMRERGQSLAGLWASMGAIYQRFGFGWGSQYVEYRFDPRTAELREPVPGRLHIDLAGDVERVLPELAEVRRRWAADRNMCLDRPDWYWRMTLVDPGPFNKRTVYVAFARDAAGTAQGYVIYQAGYPPVPFPPDGPAQELEVLDFAALGVPAYCALWEFVRSHDLVREVKVRRVAEDDLAPLLLLEPRVLNRRTADGLWLRLVDVQRALTQRPYGDEGGLVIEVEGDELCSWNSGTFALETDGTEVEVTRPKRTADIALGPAALASLYSGHSPATRLAAAGLLTAANNDALARADRLFATRHRPHCPDGF